MKGFNVVSGCCNVEIISRQGIEYPLGGSTWGIPFKYEACSSCGMEAEPVNACECCGVVGCEGVRCA